MLCRSQGALWQGSPASLQSPGTASAEPGLCPALWATQVPLRTHRNTVCSVQPHSKRLEGTSEGAGSEAKPWPSCLLLSCHLGGEMPRSRLREPATGHVYLLPIGRLSTTGTEGQRLRSHRCGTNIPKPELVKMASTASVKGPSG